MHYIPPPNWQCPPPPPPPQNLFIRRLIIFVVAVLIGTIYVVRNEPGDTVWEQMKSYSLKMQQEYYNSLQEDK